MWVATCLTGYVSMLHQNEGFIGKSTPDKVGFEFKKSQKITLKSTQKSAQKNT